MIYDLIIVGMGPSGMNAAIYAKQSGMNILVFEKNIPGGLVNTASNIDNYLGFNNVIGPDLAFKMFEHFKSYDIPFKMNNVYEITIENNIKLVHTDEDVYKAKSVIIATGRKNKRLNLENADKLEGNGISYCALCDANLYRNKDVAVYGFGKNTIEESIYLTNMCNRVYFINKLKKLIIDETLEEKIKETKNLEIINDIEIIKLNLEDNRLYSIILSNNQELIISGLFIQLGYEQASDLVNKLNITNDLGYIKVDNNQETEIKGLFACGDIIQKKVYQINNAVSEGMIAAINANKYVNSGRNNEE